MEAMDSCKQLTCIQTQHFNAYLIVVIGSVGEAYFQFRKGRIDEVHFRARVKGLMTFIQLEAGRNHYQGMKNYGMFSPEFVRENDIRMAELGDQEYPCALVSRMTALGNKQSFVV
jgi:hypothetical protein